MKLRFNRNTELEVVLFGIFKPNQIIKIDDELEAKRYLDSGYFNAVREKKREIKREPDILKLKIKEIKKEVKKSKKKGVDKE